MILSKKQKKKSIKDRGISNNLITVDTKCTILKKLNQHTYWPEFSIKEKNHKIKSFCLLQTKSNIV